MVFFAFRTIPLLAAAEAANYVRLYLLTLSLAIHPGGWYLVAFSSGLFPFTENNSVQKFSVPSANTLVHRSHFDRGYRLSQPAARFLKFSQTSILRQNETNPN